MLCFAPISCGQLMAHPEFWWEQKGIVMTISKKKIADKNQYTSRHMSNNFVYETKAVKMSVYINVIYEERRERDCT